MSHSHPLIDVWPLLMEIHDLMWAARRVYFKTPLPIRELMQEFGANPGYFGHLIYCLQNYNPQALSADHYLQRNCYDKEESLTEQFAAIAADGFLAANGDGSYRVSEKGLAFYRRVEETMNPRWGIPALAEEEVERLLAMLRRVHQTMVHAPEPPVHWSATTRARYGLRQPRGSALGDLYDLIYDLWSYRDDAHLAAWRPYYQLEPRTWETFSYVWNGKGSSLDTLLEPLQKQNGRGFSAEEYQASLDQLVEMGWLEAADVAGHYQPTAEGRYLRDEAERLTNEYFYAPWSSLDNAETADLRDIVTRLRDRLKEIAAGG